MTEMDAFERRVAETLRWYADEVTPIVDAVAVAHRVAASHPRRAERALPRPRTEVLQLRVAWLLFLVAGLLAALVGGQLITGSQPEQDSRLVLPPEAELFTCPPDTDPDQPGPVDQARPSDPFPSLAFDRRSGRVVALARVDDVVETWTFDVCTNTWLRMEPDTEPPSVEPGSGGLVYDVDSDVTVADNGSHMWAYHLEADTWTEYGPALADGDRITFWFYDPVSGLVSALVDDGDDDILGFEVSSYDVETDTWTRSQRTEQVTIGPHWEFLAYDASVDRVVVYTNAWSASGVGAPPYEPRTWLLDPRTGTWSRTEAATPVFTSAWEYGPAIAFDEGAARTVMVGDGQSASYDATVDRWTTLYGTPPEERYSSLSESCGTRPECRPLPQLVYDSVNGRLIDYGTGGVAASSQVDPDDLMALDTRTGEWTLLLAPSEGQAVPSHE